MGRHSVFGIATDCGLDGPGIESRWWRGEIFRIHQDRPWVPPSRLYIKCRVSVKIKIKVKFTLEQATKAQRWCRGIAVLYL